MVIGLQVHLLSICMALRFISYKSEPLAKLLRVFEMIPLSVTGSIKSFKATKIKPACNAMLACASKRSIAGRLACHHAGVVLQESLLIVP